MHSIGRFIIIGGLILFVLAAFLILRLSQMPRYDDASASSLIYSNVIQAADAAGFTNSQTRIFWTAHRHVTVLVVHESDRLSEAQKQILLRLADSAEHEYEKGYGKTNRVQIEFR